MAAKGAIHLSEQTLPPTASSRLDQSEAHSKTDYLPILVMHRYNFVRNFVHVQEKTMDSISYTAARSNLAKTMEQVCNDHAPIAITRKGEGAVVMISMDDYQALEETAYLLRSPKNTRRLIEAIAELEDSKGQEKELIE